MARPARALDKDDSIRLRNGVRDACDWLDIKFCALSAATGSFDKCDPDRIHNILKRAVKRQTITLTAASELLHRLESRAFEWYMSDQKKHRAWERALQRFIPKSLRARIPDSPVPFIPAIILPVAKWGEYDLPNSMANAILTIIEPFLKSGKRSRTGAFIALHDGFRLNEQPARYIVNVMEADRLQEIGKHARRG